MRRIITRDLRKRKDKKNQIIIGVVLIGLMFFSVLGYALGGRNEEENLKKIEYNSVEFFQGNDDYWYFNIQGDNFATKYNPTETKNINFLTTLTINNYVNKPLYLVGNFQESGFEISRNLASSVLRMQKACLNENDCEDNLPTKNCSIDNVIIIKETLDEVNSIHQEENCVFINSDLGNQTKYEDVFLFRILGIN